MIRAGCGTLQGALAHVAAGDPQCGWCARAEAVARLEAEGMPVRPPAASTAGPVPPAEAPRPVTAEQAARNAAIAAAEMTEWEQDHPGSRHHQDGPLRVIPCGGTRLTATA